MEAVLTAWCLCLCFRRAVLQLPWAALASAALVLRALAVVLVVVVVGDAGAVSVTR